MAFNGHVSFNVTFSCDTLLGRDIFAESIDKKLDALAQNFLIAIATSFAALLIAHSQATAG